MIDVIPGDTEPSRREREEINVEGMKTKYS